VPWIFVLEVPFVIALLWLAVQASLLLYTRRRSKQFSTALLRLNDAAQNTVKEIQQVVAGDFKAARVDGRLKGDTAAELRATAIKSIQAQLGPTGMKEIRTALGLSRKAPIDRVLVGRLEAAVYDLKDHSAIPEKVASGPGARFVPDTMRIPRAQVGLPPEDTLFDEQTKITRREP
jgi:hypothetical protein